MQARPPGFPAIHFQAGIITRIAIRSGKFNKDQPAAVGETTMKALRQLVNAEKSNVGKGEVTLRSLRYKDGTQVGIIDTTIEQTASPKQIARQQKLTDRIVASLKKKGIGHFLFNQIFDLSQRLPS